MLNSNFINREAAHFADVVRKQHDEPAEQVKEILSRVTQREPTEEEIEKGVSLMIAWQEEDSLDANQALNNFCLAALNLNEFIFVE